MNNIRVPVLVLLLIALLPALASGCTPPEEVDVGTADNPIVMSFVPSGEMEDIASGSEVVRDMILRNFARENPAIDILDRLHAVVDRADCYILTYDTLDQAAALLDEGFGIIPVGKRHVKTT